MTNKNEHPGTFKDNPEERMIHIKIKLEPGIYIEHGSEQQNTLDTAIHETVAETADAPTVRIISSRLNPEEPSYEARLQGVGPETFFHALGSACLKRISGGSIVGVGQRAASWSINSPQSMQGLVRFE